MTHRLSIAVLLGLLLGTGLAAQGTLSNQVLQLLTRVNTWTATNTFLDLRLSRGVPVTTLDRFYEDTVGNLFFNGTLVAGTGGVTNPHNLLSTTHPDTLAAAAARGAVIVGNSTPAWARLTIGGAGAVLRSDGTDVSWSTNGSALTTLTAANLTGALPAIDGTSLTGLNATSLTSGTVPLARLSNIANAQIAAGAGIVYSKLTLTGSVVNADLVAGTLTNTAINAAAAIAYAKLSLTASLLFADWAVNGCVNTQIPKYNGAAWACAADNNSGGTATSVALTAPAIFSVAGSPVTTAGTLAITLANETANLVWAGPSGGGAAAPTFRALVNADLPLTGVAAATYPKVTVNTAGMVTAALAQITLTTDVTGILPMANGGTGVAVAVDDTLLVGSGAAWVAQTLPNCVTGALNYTQATNLFSCNATPAGHTLLSAVHTDTVANTVVRGDLVVGNSTPRWTRLARGTIGQLLSGDGNDPAWVDTIARGAVGVSAPWTFTQTWTVGGTTYRGVEISITDTASAAGSTLFRALGGAAGATERFSVTNAGATTATGGPIKDSLANLLVVETDGIILENATPSAGGGGLSRQISPRVRFRAHAWNGAASETFDVQNYLYPNFPVVGRGLLYWGFSLNGAAYSYPMWMDTNGALTIASTFTIGGAMGLVPTAFDGGTILATSAGVAGACLDFRTVGTLKVLNATCTAATGTLQVPTVTNSAADLTLSTTTSGNVVLSPFGDIKWGKALVALGGGAAPTVGTIGGAGPAAAAQNTWMRVLDSTGAAFFVPAWK